MSKYVHIAKRENNNKRGFLIVNPYLGKHVPVDPNDVFDCFEKMAEQKTGESSASIRERVIKARKIQEKRFANHPSIYCNAQMESKLLQQYATPDEQGLRLLRNAMNRLNLSARAYDRILKVARTIADLEGSEHIQSHHLAEAIGYRNLDRESWGG